MCEVGRIKHHLKHNLYRPECTVLFVGYQADGTLGKRILSGEKLVKIFGEEIAVKAEIRNLDAFSGHADKDGLLDWIDEFDQKPKNIFIVHGEYDVQQKFSELIKERFNINTVIPDYEESYTPDGSLIKLQANNVTNNRLEIMETLASLKQQVDVLTNSVKSEMKNGDLNVDNLADIKQKLASLQTSISTIKR